MAKESTGLGDGKVFGPMMGTVSWRSSCGDHEPRRYGLEGLRRMDRNGIRIRFPGASARLFGSLMVNIYSIK